MHQVTVERCSNASVARYYIKQAASVDVVRYWPGLFAKALEGVNVRDLITNVGSGVEAAPAAGAPAAAAAAAPAAEAAKEEKKEEEPEESDDDMGFGLFD
ncbi:60S acidic ribosomal protein P1-like [Melitaea cinxia]|uniref:60S acidic ribosomal protein P1-like n=1 Tax=Melitaea cinxia TaxID=113334 RepID=UPI001E271A1D|nr:60S acidic ribosomal protein P1-like [Melitaea cinxia]